jgi:hypothetical protein
LEKEIENDANDELANLLTAYTNQLTAETNLLSALLQKQSSGAIG